MDINKALLLCLLLLPSLVFAHGGRTDKFGCHNRGTPSQTLRAFTNFVDINSQKTIYLQLYKNRLISIIEVNWVMRKLIVRLGIEDFILVLTVIVGAKSLKRN